MLFQNVSILPPWQVIEIPREGGGGWVLKAKLLEEKYEAQMEFPGGEGVQNKKTFHGGSMHIFWNYTSTIHL